jgi:hypothetical protein
MLPTGGKERVTSGIGDNVRKVERLSCTISHTVMSHMPFVREQAPGKRRSQRVKIPMQIRMAPADPAADPNPFRATATNLNRHGALVCSEREVKVGSHVLVTNPKHENALARVVSEAQRRNSLRQYGIEFMDNSTGATFWGLTFVRQEST